MESQRSYIDMRCIDQTLLFENQKMKIKDPKMKIEDLKMKIEDP